MQIEKDLWEKIANDDQQAYASVFRLLYQRLYNYGKKFTNENAIIEDSAQETLLSLWTKRKNLNSISFPATYFFTTFRNILFARLKGDHKFLSPDKIYEEPEFGVDHIIFHRETDLETRQKIEKGLNALTPRQREAIFLRFFEDMSYEAVAEMLGITVKATYKIMARALEELRQAMNLSAKALILLLVRL